MECDGCGETTCAALPPGVPQGQSGPRLIAFTALLMAYYRQSKRRTAEFLSTLLAVRVAVYVSRLFHWLHATADGSLQVLADGLEGQVLRDDIQTHEGTLFRHPARIAVEEDEGRGRPAE